MTDLSLGQIARLFVGGLLLAALLVSLCWALVHLPL